MVMGNSDQDFSDFTESADNDRDSRNTLRWVGAILFVVLFLWIAVSTSGLAPWLGTVDESYRDGRVEMTSAAVEDTSTDLLSLSSFFFLSGQEVYVDYDITVRRGAVQIIVQEHAGPERTFRHMVTASGSGTFTVPVPRSGIYHISLLPTADGGVGSGNDVDISASWGARWP